MTGPIFGRASLYITRNGIARRIGILQDLGFNMDFDSKLLHGQKSLAISAAVGIAKFEGKSKFAEFDSAVLRDIMLARMDSGVSTKTPILTEDAQNTVPGTPYELSVANLDSVVAVYDVTAGIWLEQVSGTPADATEFKATTGVSGKIAFHSGATAHVVKATYITRHATETGATMLINTAMSEPLYFKLVAHRKFDGKAATIILNKCFSPKLSLLDIKDDYSMPEFDFTVIDDEINGIGEFSFGSAT